MYEALTGARSVLKFKPLKELIGIAEGGGRLPVGRGAKR